METPPNAEEKYVWAHEPVNKPRATKPKKTTPADHYMSKRAALSSKTDELFGTSRGRVREPVWGVCSRRREWILGGEGRDWCKDVLLMIKLA